MLKLKLRLIKLTAGIVIVMTISWYFAYNYQQVKIVDRATPAAQPDFHKSSHRFGTRTCHQPVTNIVFVKTHKTSSTAVANLLQQYWKNQEGHGRETSPQPHPFVGGYPGRFRCEYKYPKHATSNFRHTRFDAEEMRKCFEPNTRYISIVREPRSAFLSAFNFYRGKFKDQPRCFGMPLAYLLGGGKLDVNQFLLKCAGFLNETVPWYFRFQNYQAHDLGMEPTLKNKEEIGRQIDEIDKNMDLVLLHEYLDESLLLLKETLCMGWDDVILERISPTFNVAYEFASGEHENIFRQLNNIDIALYEHFNRTLWKRVDLYGQEKFADDLLKIRELRARKRRHVGNQEKEKTEELEALSEEWWKSLKHYMMKNAGGCYMPGGKKLLEKVHV